MRKRVLRHRILWGFVAILLIAASIVTIVFFATQEKAKGRVLDAKVVRASLSSSLSSAGEISTVSTKVAVPLAALTVEEPDRLSDITANDYTVNILTLLGENASEPVVWKLLFVNERYEKSSVCVSSEAADETIARLAPVTLDWEKLTAQYRLELSAGTTEAGSVREYVLTLLLRDGASDIAPSRFPSDFWVVNEEAAVTVGTAEIAAMMKKEMPYVDDLVFTVSGLTWNVGDILLLDNKLFTVSYSERFVNLLLSEYDVAGIHARMRADERVYAAVSINALGGRDLVAELVHIGTASVSSGVTYYSLLGRLVFPESAEENGKTIDSYGYYDADFLTADNVRYLGVDLSSAIREEELLDKYSVTVTAQKTVVKDTLVVPTKCIYYDDSRKPYVVKLDADGKEKRVFIKVNLSTGTDAAVTPLEEGALDEGDILHYTAEASLIGSLF